MYGFALPVGVRQTDRIFPYNVSTQSQHKLTFPAFPAGYIALMAHHLPRSPEEPISCLAGLAARCLLAASLAPGLAFATLGEDGSTVEHDRAQLRAQRSVSQASAYSVHELQLPGGTQVREYLTAANQVFAVAWNGPSIPDLQQLLGTYFPRYQAAAQANQGARRPVVVQASDLVVRTGGHPRAFFGMVYLPAQMPSGVSAEQIR